MIYLTLLKKKIHYYLFNFKARKFNVNLNSTSDSFLKITQKETELYAK